MLKIDMNTMANLVAMGENGRTEVNIAQIKEVMSIFLNIFLRELSTHSDEEILGTVRHYNKERNIKEPFYTF